MSTCKLTSGQITLCGEVNLIFLIGGLIDRQEDYLKLLAALSASVKSEENRKKLLDCKTEESFLECLTSRD